MLKRKNVRIHLDDIYVGGVDLKSGDIAFLSGDIVIMRDRAHRLFIEKPRRKIDFHHKAIFYAGPLKNGILGPTTSLRMDDFTLWFAKERGVRVFIGKGQRDEELLKRLKEMDCVCGSTFGGVSSYLSKKFKKPEPVLYEGLDCEAIFYSTMKNVPVQIL